MTSSSRLQRDCFVQAMKEDSGLLSSAHLWRSSVEAYPAVDKAEEQRFYSLNDYIRPADELSSRLQTQVLDHIKQSRASEAMSE
jgi:hypothetical protein